MLAGGFSCHFYSTNKLLTGGGLCSWEYCPSWYSSGRERWCPDFKSWEWSNKVGFFFPLIFICSYFELPFGHCSSLGNFSQMPTPLMWFWINLCFRYDGLHHGSSYLEHLHFLSAIRAKAKAPAVDLHDGLVSVAIGVAAQLSIEKGRFVTIEEVMS